MSIQGLGAFNLYDTPQNGKLDGKISLGEFLRNREQFVKDFICLPISQKMNVLTKMDKAAKAELKKTLERKWQQVDLKAKHALDVVNGRYMVSDFFAKRTGKAIEFAMQTGSAEEISNKDFDHGHILIPYDDLKHYQGAATSKQLETLLASRGCVVLYHTQEFTGKFREPHNYHRRNLVQDLNENISTAKYMPYCEKEIEYSSGIGPQDVGATDVGHLTFELDPDGEYSFMHKGKVYRYSAYVVLTPQVIETKISTLDFIRQQAVHWCDYGSSADIE